MSSGELEVSPQGPPGAVPATGVTGVERARVVLEGALDMRCSISAWTPSLTDGRRPPRPSRLLVLPGNARLQPGAPPGEDPAIVFDHDGVHVVARALFPAGTSFYGTGEVAGPLLRNGRTVTLWNTDAMPYDESSSSLYQAHPFVLAVLPDGRAVGLLADTARRGTIALGSETVELAFEEEPFDVYRIEADHPIDVTRGLAALVGRIAMPPAWALGYHQCRWSYASADELRALAAEFRRRGIPCDALWLDIDYMDRFRVFTWNEATFPDLPGLTAELRGQGFCTVAILDPGVAVESELAEVGLEHGHFVLDAAGEPVTGRVWPGTCYFPDFTSERVRAWWADEVRAFVERTGIDGLWNDMNEPAVFDVPSRTLPDDARHAGFDGSGGSHAEWHNLYGQAMAWASFEGLVRARPEQRPFLLTRANHVSGARFAATWTGDNRARWDDLRWSISMALNLGLSGQPFAGPDAGGFSDNPSPELFARWFALAALLPFFRGHAEKSSRRKEPWELGPRVETWVRAAIELRMRLFPTLYTLFREAHESGGPIVRPVFFADPADPELRALDDAFLLGDALLAAPVVHERAHERSVLFPRVPGGWIPFSAGAAESSAAGPILERERVVPAPLGSVPLFARAGSILFECAPRASTALPPVGPLVVHVFLDPDGRAEGRLYEDEGEGHAHARGVFRDTRFHARSDGNELVIDEQATGSFESPLAARYFIAHVAGRTLRFARPRAATQRRAL